MVKWMLTGGLIPPMLLLCGGFFTVYLKGYPARSPRRMLLSLRDGEKKNGVSSFRALSEALAGTLGVGNIVGVANAIAIGGAGAVFWMWVSALIATVLKYAETVLAVAHRRTRRDGSHFGGAFYYIKDCFFQKKQRRIGAFLSSVFALFMIFNALSMGCVIQVRAVTSAVGNVNVPAWGIAVLLFLITLPLLLCGRRGISALTECLVPIMTAGYIILSVAVLVLRREAIGDALASVLSSAFSFQSLGGGCLGFFTSQALRVGTMRGLLSNEAGCGTSPTAHAGADASSPAAQGVWGILEVLVDTVLLCTLTALVILVNASEVEMLAFDGMQMAIRAYSSVLGGASELFFAIATFCFGYATLLCWGGYGMEALSFLSGKRRWRFLYLCLFSACIFIGALGDADIVWDISDVAITVLTTVNLFVLFAMRREVRMHTLDWIAGDREKNNQTVFRK